MFDGKLRFYDQPRAASFYSDLFPYADSQNFMARHKELSVFTSQDIRLEASYDILKSGWKFLDKGTLNIVYDHMLFNYDDFRDLRVTGMTPGTEPLYNFDADVFQVFVSFWF
jgi:hypothetical protein